MERSSKERHHDSKMSGGEGANYGSTGHKFLPGSGAVSDQVRRWTRIGYVTRHIGLFLGPLQILLSKPPRERKQRDIERSRAFARKLSPLIRQMDNVMLDYTLAHVQMETYKFNQIIVKEGDIGNKLLADLPTYGRRGSQNVLDLNSQPQWEAPRFYLMMSGCASVYTSQSTIVKTTVNSQSGDYDEYATIEDMTKQQVETILAHDMKRDVLGKFYQTLERGVHFGELALLSEDGMRNASVVADGDCSVMTFDKELYSQTIKLQQNIEFERRHNFVTTHPFFRHLHEKCCHQLQVLLEHQVFGLGEDIITQNSAAGLLIFIVSGEARISTDPSRHRKQLCSEVLYHPNAAIKMDIDEEEEEKEKPKIVERRLTFSASSRGRNQDSIPLPHISDAVALRRIDGYVAAERKSFDRAIDLCFVRSGEVLGDLEYLTGLTTYLFTVKCTSECEVYYISTKALERQIIRKNPHTLEFMRWWTEKKLKIRMSSEQGKKVSVLSTLINRLKASSKSHSKSPGKFAANADFSHPSVKASLGSRPPSQHVQLRQITRLFLENKVPLLVPYTDGAVYYRELLRKRAQLRAERRQLQQKESFMDFPSVQRQLSDAKIENHKEVILFDKKRQRLMSKGNIEQIDINRWK